MVYVAERLAEYNNRYDLNLPTYLPQKVDFPRIHGYWLRHKYKNRIMAKISSPKQFRGEVKRRGDALYLILPRE
jgi:hypothetical protein